MNQDSKRILDPHIKLQHSKLESSRQHFANATSILKQTQARIKVLLIESTE